MHDVYSQECPVKQDWITFQWTARYLNLRYKVCLEKGSDQLIVTLYKLYIYLCTIRWSEPLSRHTFAWKRTVFWCTLIQAVKVKMLAIFFTKILYFYEIFSLLNSLQNKIHTWGGGYKGLRVKTFNTSASDHKQISKHFRRINKNCKL